MKKLNELMIGRFRGITQLRINDLGDVNIFVGDNNVGKTSILEAVHCFSSPDKIENMVRVSRLRVARNALPRPSFLDSFVSFFPFDEKEKYLSLSAEINGERHDLEVKGTLEQRIVARSVRRRALPNEEEAENESIEREETCFVGELFYNGVAQEILLPDESVYMLGNSELMEVNFISPARHLTNPTLSLRTVRHKEEIVDLLRLFDNRISGFDLVREEGNRVTEVIHHQTLGVVPLYVFGDGLKRVLTLATSVFGYTKGILLIDEIETSIHISVLEEVFRWFVQACKRVDVQVFATTHSLESLKILASVAAEEKESDLVVFKIERFEDKFYSKRFGEEQLDFVINEKGQDIR